MVRFFLASDHGKAFGYDSYDLSRASDIPFRRVVAHLHSEPFLAKGITNVIAAFNVPADMVNNPRHRIVLGPEHLPLILKASGGLRRCTLDVTYDGAALPEYRPDWGVYIPLNLVNGTEATDLEHSRPLIEDGDLVFIAAYNERHNIITAADFVHGADGDWRVAIERTQALITLLRQVGVPIPEQPVRVDEVLLSFPGEPITLGADPEFELVRGGRIVSARHIISERTLPWGSVGLDGAGDQIELRPNPGSPEELVANVGRLLLSVPHISGGYPSTMCEVWPTGGHIHIGFRNVGNVVRHLENIVGAIDAMLGDLLHSLNSKTRVKNGYGKRGDWRRQEWGIEYRTPPANIWSHPEVALAFLRAIEHIVKKMVHEGVWSPEEDPEWPALYQRVVIATRLVKKYEGRLHWGAWKAWVGDFNLARDANIVIDFASDAQYDSDFVNDLRLMLVRVGIPRVQIIPLKASRGERISNVPGYGELYDGVERFSFANPTLALSWRFRNDPAFRREEMPYLERAILDIVSDNEEDDANRLIKDPVPLEGDWPEVPEPEPIPHEGDDDDDDDDMIRCDACGGLFHEDDITYNRWDQPFCMDCYHDRYTYCIACDGEVRREDVIYYDDEPYCEECYANNFSPCEVCEEDYPHDILFEVMVRNRDGDLVEMYVCEHCREHNLEEDDEEEDVYRIRR